MAKTVQEFPGGKEQYVHTLFSKIARRYDLLNRLLSFRQDVAWRRFTARAVKLQPGDCVLDVATGTGDLAFELARHVAPSGKVIGVDFVEAMLVLAREKAKKHQLGGYCEFLQGNAMELPFPDGAFAGATIAFALRNVRDIEGCLTEMRRVVRPGGRVVSLELSKPVWPVFKQLYYLYFYRLVPLIGRIFQGDSGPYTYLPHSLTHFPGQEELADLMRKVGFRQVTYHNLTGGIVAVHVGVV